MPTGETSFLQFLPLILIMGVWFWFSSRSNKRKRLEAETLRLEEEKLGNRIAAIEERLKKLEN